VSNPAIRKDSARAARQRARETQDERIYVNLAQLVRLAHQATGFSFLPRQPLNSLLAGRHGSKIRGRGLNFEELRAYLPGDDIRSIDWKVTARTRTPHIRVYTEERERSAYLLVDQRQAMFYGTRVRMKSVTAAEAAALGAWRILAMGDRAGALVFDDTRVTEIRPQRSRQTVMRILQEVVDRNRALRADSATPPDPGMLPRALDQVRRRAGHDALVVVISDFDGLDEQSRGILLKLNRHNDVIAVLVHDPSATELPAGSDFVISDGELQVELRLGEKRMHQRIHEAAQGRIAQILETLHGIQVPVLPLETVADVAHQVRRLLGTLPRYK
jgi:uncharacterized protein (DUF58 family)